MISRRQFLQVTGISAYGLSSASFLNSLALAAPVESTGQEATFGRVLFPATVTNENGITISNLIPDTVVQIVHSSDATYMLNQGVISRNAVQPMADFGAESFVPETPCAIEVVAPVATVRHWCAPNAPLISRVGHGGVLYVIDSLIIQGTRWLGVADQPDGVLIGWTEAVRWRETGVQPEALSLADSLEVNRLTQQLSAYNGDQLLWSVNAAVSESLPAGQYSLGGRVASARMNDNLGVPWTHHFGDYELLGAYWHNAFGQETGRRVSGSAVQIPTAAARWIFRHFRSNGTLHVV